MKKKFSGAALAAALAGACAVQAQTTPIRPRYEPPAEPTEASVREGALLFSPFVNLAAGYDDNVALTRDNISSPVYIASPGFLLDVRDANRIIRASWQSALAYYSDAEDNNYTDHTFRGSLDWAFGSRHAFRLGYDWIHGHEARGATDRPTANTRPDKYRLSTPAFLYAFGGRGAQGRIEVYYSDAHRRYTNNRDVTIFADRDTEDLGAAFYWRVMPRTHAIFEARRTEVGYKALGAGLDSREDRLYVGATWEATAATSGTIKLGYLRKQFESGFPDYSGASWEALVTWSPRTYSRFDFYSSRQPVESTGLGRFILSQQTGINWTHAWSSVLNTTVGLRHQNDSYQGFNRKDETWGGVAKVVYKFRRWLALGAEYNYTTRDSSQASFGYDRNLWLLTAEFTF